MSAYEATVQGRELGFRLRTVMEAAELKAAGVARMLGREAPWVSRVLSGQRGIQPVDVAAFLAVCGVTGPLREEVLALAAVDSRRTFTRQGAVRLDSYRYHVSTAWEVVEFAPHVLPWVLRTEDYTHALHGPGGVAHEDAYHHRALARIPHERRAPVWSFVVHEWVLRTPWGPVASMREQLGHLGRLSLLPTVCLRVLPIGAGPVVGAAGPFAVLRYRHCPSAVYREEGDVGVFTDDRAEVARYHALADRISTATADVTASRALLKRIAADLPTISAAAGGDVA